MARREKVLETEIVVTRYGGKHGQGQLVNLDRMWPSTTLELLEKITAALEREIGKAWPPGLTEDELLETPHLLRFSIDIERKGVVLYGK